MNYKTKTALEQAKKDMSTMYEQENFQPNDHKSSLPGKKTLYLHTLHMSGVGKRSFRDMLQNTVHAKLKHKSGKDVKSSSQMGHQARIECSSDDSLYSFLKILDEKTFADKHAACDFGKILVTHGSLAQRESNSQEKNSEELSSALVYHDLQVWKKAYSQKDQALQNILFALSLCVRNVLYIKKEEDLLEKSAEPMDMSVRNGSEKA